MFIHSEHYKRTLETSQDRMNAHAMTLINNKTSAFRPVFSLLVLSVCLWPAVIRVKACATRSIFTLMFLV